MKKIIIAIAVLLILATLSILTILLVKQHKTETMHAAEPNKTVHLVFTTDKTYAKYLRVTLYSLITNKKPDSIYDINILCVDLDKNEQELFKKKYETKNVTVNIIPVSLEEITFGNYEILNERISRADLFKFFMPKIFENLDKILYIDADTLIKGDLLDLYNTDIKKYYLGAVLKYSPNVKVIHIPFRKVLFHYDYNCGVMLLNLEKMRKNKITEKLIKTKEKDKLRALMTQTTFNSVIPTRKALKLDPKYNFYARLRDDDDFRYFELKKIYAPYLDDINGIEEMQKRAIIVHYAGPAKPWYDNDLFLYDALEWRKYALKDNPNYKSDGIKFHPLDY